MFSLRKFSIRNFDWILFTAVFLLLVTGLAAIYSVDLSRGSELFYFKKQLIAAGIGLFILFVASATQYTFFRATAKWWYVAAAVLLISVLIAGRVIRGTKGWFLIGGFSFQPVEFAKIGLILMLGHIISRFGRNFDRPLFFFGTGIITLGLIALVMMQPDLGSAVLLGMIWFGFMFLAGARKLHMILLVAGVIALGVFSWFFLLQDYQKDRLAVFVDPQKDQFGAGYNVTQSIIAVGAGKIFGRGLGFGSQSQLRFLPEAQTDFIFSVIGEELGMAGLAVILFLFGIIFWRLYALVINSNDEFMASVASGAAILFFCQFFINIGANLGLLPVTGVTLPFISYGGSSLIMNLLLVGIVESMVGERY
ncbi:rod shape-determining protein RodA [Patescibacteria group bacterium]|nr:rod shape-determining protein RodA [Patescibacteria group bacterium]